MGHQDYDTLIAAHLLRDPSFAAAFGPLFLKTGGFFFREFFLREPVCYSLEIFESTGQLLPAQALKVDANMYGSNGASQENYDIEIDKAFGVPETVLDRSRNHVQERLLEEIQSRLLLRTDLHGLCSVGSLDKLWASLDEIRSLGVEKDGAARRLSEGLLETLRDPPQGHPTGLGPLDACLSAGGPTSGETVLFYGRYSIGKSILINHCVRHGARVGRAVLLWAVGDGSQKLVEMRLAKGILGWSDQRLREDPETAYRSFLDIFGDLPLYVIHSPPSKTGRAQILAQIDRVEQSAGRKLDVLAMDYSEKRAKGRDWNQVADAYAELRDICGERSLVGFDVAQENQSGTISYFNLLKDADIGVQLTILHPAEWARRQSSFKGEDKLVDVPTRGVVYGKIVRAREGSSGDVFELWVDRETGIVRPRERGAEEE